MHMMDPQFPKAATPPSTPPTIAQVKAKRVVARDACHVPHAVRGTSLLQGLLHSLLMHCGP